MIIYGEDGRNGVPYGIDPISFQNVCCIYQEILAMQSNIRRIKREQGVIAPWILGLEKRAIRRAV